ncbi:MAG: RNA polymerase sigma factor [Acetobacteraceae bacterium]|nr:RNA polymerase sigma factor [Acetobacteraceae bacterium]
MSWTALASKRCLISHASLAGPILVGLTRSGRSRSSSQGSSPLGETDWISAALKAARPQAVAALLRYFRDLDAAEEAFQEACLRALKSWPKNGPPRDAAAWLIMVGKNAGIDGVRKQAREQPLPPEELISDLADAEQGAVDRIDEADYRDDILRLLFACCHPRLPATQQIALALRIVSGLSVAQIARAFLVSETAMEQRITRAKARIAAAQVPFETPGAIERSERLAAVASMVYLVFNEGYTVDVAEHGARAPLCEEAIRLARLLLRLFPSEPEIMGLLALLLLQHARAPARFDADGAAVLLEEQDRTRWNPILIAEGLALIDKAVRHRRPGPYQTQAAIAALHARAASPQATDWAGIEQLYGALEVMQPSPVVTLNRAVAVSKVRGPAEALAMIEPLDARLGGYFYFHGARGAFLLELGRTEEARVAFDHAIALANTPAEAAHIRNRIDQLIGDGRSKCRRPILSQQA